MSLDKHIPAISVLLPVHNAMHFLAEALASLEVQTCRDFEVIAVDDASTDGSGEALDHFAVKYQWLRVFHQERGGIAVALNRAFLESKGGFIARMDADDVADPRRFELQIEFLNNHIEVGVCGSWALAFGEGKAGVVRAPITDDAIRSWLVFGSAFVHPTVMVRRVVLERFNQPYEPNAPPLEDYSLWLRLSGSTHFYNLPVVLLRYRRHHLQVTRKQSSHHEMARLADLRVGLLTGLGIELSASEARVHAALGWESVPSVAMESNDVAAWLERLCKTLPETGWCSEQAMRSDCANAWWRYMQKGHGGPAAAWAFGRAAVAGRTPRTLFRMARLALR